MRLVVARSADGLSVPALYSEAEGPTGCVIVHVHGWGGDFCSNGFVQMSHEYFPARGVGFVSLNLRTSGYLVEKYSEAGVSYVGASVTNPFEALSDIDAIVEALSLSPEQLILQGHSFGTNLVRVYAARHPELRRAIYLSPSDSVSLYDRWRSARSRQEGRVARLPEADGEAIEWSLFGMASGQASYPIPIAPSLLRELIDGVVFTAWSEAGPTVSQESLVVLGAADPIASVGTTAHDHFFRQELNRVTLIRIPEAKHLFGGLEEELLDAEYRWVLWSAPEP